MRYSFLKNPFHIVSANYNILICM